VAEPVAVIAGDAQREAERLARVCMLQGHKA
jgi:hypothetical protein